MKTIALKPVKEDPSDFDKIEAEIIKVFREEIYLPLIRELGDRPSALHNSIEDLVEAIKKGKIRFDRGQFRGSFNSTLTRELKRIGAVWDRRQGSFSIPASKLSIDIKQAIAVSEYKFDQAIKKIDKRLSVVSPKELSDKLSIQKHFDRALYKTDQKISASMKDIVVSPKFTPEQAKRFSDEYVNNMQIYIQDFAEKEIKELREKISERAYRGLRYEGVIKEIQDSYGVSQRKAKFLARQETALLMTKYKQIRYQDAGVDKYKWKCVTGTAAHPVRPMHKALDGKIISWDNPPVVDENGNKKHAGVDYGCRCTSIPIITFK